MTTTPYLFIRCRLLLCVLHLLCYNTPAFLLLSNTHHNGRSRSSVLVSHEKTTDSIEADRLREKAEQLRREIAQAEAERREEQLTRPSSLSAKDTTETQPPKKTNWSPWSLPPVQPTDNSPCYRIYADIGREDGSWMEPRWGASGTRMEFTLDVRFSSLPAPSSVQEDMVQDNMANKRSKVYTLETAPSARLRQGFDKMGCINGGYRLDSSKQAGKATARFFMVTDGKKAGDVEIPKGPLYFSLPVFGNDFSQLSRKEGIVSVRQGGWNTGWYRQESRIVGVFRAVPLQQAIAKDGF